MSEQIEIKSNDRLGIFGKTGSGKTYAVKELIWKDLDRVVFHDWKAREYKDLAAPVLRSLDDVHTALFAEREEDRLFKFVYVPDATADGYDEWDELCRLVYERGDMHLIGDEIKGIYQKGNATKPVTDYHNAIMTRGRDKGVGMSNLSQRPKKVPKETISEAEHLFAFRLNLKSDREEIGEVVGRDHADAIGDLSTGEFLYYHQSWDEPKISQPL